MALGGLGVESPTVVIHADADGVVAHVHLDLHARRLAVPGRVSQQFLNGAEDHDLQVRLQAAFGAGNSQRRIQRRLFLEGFDVLADRRCQTQVVQHHRAQFKDEVAQFLEGSQRRALQAGQLVLGLLRIDIHAGAWRSRSAG